MFPSNRELAVAVATCEIGPNSILAHIDRAFRPSRGLPLDRPWNARDARSPCEAVDENGPNNILAHEDASSPGYRAGNSSG